MPAHCNCEDCHSLINLRTWITTHPFPSYEEMCSRIDKQFDFMLSMELGAEYGEYNHDAMKKMYESHMDETLCKKLGNDIYARGGLKALSANCTIFKYCTPLADASPHVADHAAILEWYWDGIGGFKKYI